MAAAPEPEKKKKKPLPWMLIAYAAIAMINFALLGSGLYMVYSSTIGWHAPQITENQLEAAREKEIQTEGELVGPLVYTMDKFTVNLAGDPLRDPKRTIQIEVNLEMLNREGFEEVITNDNRAKARDKIIQILGTKTFTELETIQGKLFLKDQISTEMNSLLDKGVVKDVYFTSFVVQ